MTPDEASTDKRVSAAPKAQDTVTATSAPEAQPAPSRPSSFGGLDTSDPYCGTKKAGKPE